MERQQNMIELLNLIYPPCNINKLELVLKLYRQVREKRYTKISYNK